MVEARRATDWLETAPEIQKELHQGIRMFYRGPQQ